MANLQSDALSYAKKRTAYRSVYYLVSSGRLMSAPTPLRSLHTVFSPHPHPATWPKFGKVQARLLSQRKATAQKEIAQRKKLNFVIKNTLSV